MLCRHILVLVAAAMLAAASLASPPDPASPATPQPPAASRDRLLFILADGFNVQEFWGTYVPLSASGYRIDIAGIDKGVIFANREKPSDRDTAANLTLKDVKIDDYAALMISGGFSPGNLESHPESIQIVRAFLNSGRPVAAICHGPRLLMRADVLRNRKMTCWFEVSSELADAWRDGIYGNYFDQPVVIDGNLITSRYPNDAPLHARATLQMLAARGSLPVPNVAGAKVTVYLPGATGHARWTATQLSALGMVVTPESDVAALLAKPELLTAADYVILAAPADAAKLDLSAITPVLKLLGKSKAALLVDNVWLHAAKAAGIAPRPLESSALAPALREVVDCAHASARFQPPAVVDGSVAAIPKLPESLPPPGESNKSAVVALSPGFDEQVVAAVLDAAAKGDRGFNSVVAIAQSKGTIRGLHGQSLRVDATYADVKSLPAGSLVIAPGSVWPMKTNARQAKQPEWINQQDSQDKARLAWLLEQRSAGAVLVAVGFDAWRLGIDAQFKDCKFAASPQTVWSFPSGGGKYSPAAAIRSAERLVTATSAASLADALDLAAAERAKK